MRDTRPGRTRLDPTDRSELERVLGGLRSRPRRIDPKYHYDERGSRLFERITTLDEYYLTRTERALLETWMPAWVADLRPATLVELGAGSAEKSRLVLDAMVAAACGRAYVPVDVSADFLARTAEALEREYPQLEVVPEVADFVEPLDLPRGLPRPRWIALLGSTLGNFEAQDAIRILGRIAGRLGLDDRFLLGVDLRPGPSKSVARIEAAYDDAQGVTAEFSLNILDALNAEVGSDFDRSAFRHRSRYDAARGRIETFLDALRAQDVHFPNGEVIHIGAGEAIRTEISAKYDHPTVHELFVAAGLRVDRWVEDEDRLYALVLGAAAD